MKENERERMSCDFHINKKASYVRCKSFVIKKTSCCKENRQKYFIDIDLI